MTRIERLVIERLGHRGEGIAQRGDARVFVPYALAGETVTAQVGGETARLVDVLDASPDRIAPICPYYMRCGGCAVQTLRRETYAQWKRSLVDSALHNAGIAAEVAPLVDAHGAGRRRATFHARMENGAARVGFMAARSHEVVEIDSCPLLAPDLSGALKAARALADALATRGKPLDIAVTATLDGLDVDLRGAGPLDDAETAALVAIADACKLARLSNHGRLIAQRAAPWIDIGGARVVIPPGGFLQATQAGEEALAAEVCAAASGARSVADLFCGVGAFALRLARQARVFACDSDAAAIEALRAAARDTPGLRPLEGAARDLFKRPLSAAELSDVDCVVFDPPRAGAQAQAQAIAGSSLRKVVAVSCDARSFARDAAILCGAGFALGEVTPVDQFLYSPHVEIVAVFARGPLRRAGKRALLG